MFVIMPHSFAGEGEVNLALLMPFYAQLTILFFMTVSGMTFSSSYDKGE